MLKIEVGPVLAALVIAQRANATQRQAIRRATAKSAPMVRQTVAARAAVTTGLVGQALAQSVQVTTTTRGVRVKMGSSGSVGTKHPFPLKEAAPVWEFGGDPERWMTFTGRAGGKVTRRTQRQIPKRNATGHMFYPSVAEVAPELVAAWIGAVVAEWRKDGW